MSKPPISRADILQALDESRAERDQQLDAVLLCGIHHLRPLTISDRLALALCRANTDIGPCKRPCEDCRFLSAAVAHEIATILRERHGGSSQTADWLDAVNTCDPKP
jgi:hypothetical protein